MVLLIDVPVSGIVGSLIYHANCTSVILICRDWCNFDFELMLEKVNKVPCELEAISELFIFSFCG